ncbi:MAG: prepilin-type N-terminal cleavage/methylation domain-containing protein, partial [Candidatus Omnitrophica bacterium]|nr:prepilin-type N-terminal cleavage/methylation domain-containing protein [Candidatus Omnitrophota bacterium]
MRKKYGFTIMEVMLVVFLLSVMASFALVQFNKATLKSREKSAIVQLKVIHAANEIYKARNGHFNRDSNTKGGPLNLDEINSSLNINLVSNGLTFSY